jgi:hypothetical protein
MYKCIIQSLAHWTSGLGTAGKNSVSKAFSWSSSAHTESGGPYSNTLVPFTGAHPLQSVTSNLFLTQGTCCLGHIWEREEKKLAFDLRISNQIFPTQNLELGPRELSS